MHLRLLVVSLVLMGCTVPSAARSVEDREGDATSASSKKTAAKTSAKPATTSFAGAWKYEEKCTKDGEPVDCAKFARINSIPKSMHFYGEGLGALLMLPFGETNADANAEIGAIKEADPLTWGDFAVGEDGVLTMVLGNQIPYVLEKRGDDTLAYCYPAEKTCVTYSRQGPPAKALEDRLALYQKNRVETKHGDVLFACQTDETRCDEHIYPDALSYIATSKGGDRCSNGEPELRECPASAKSRGGCRLDIFTVSVITWGADTSDPNCGAL